MWSKDIIALTETPLFLSINKDSVTSIFVTFLIGIASTTIVFVTKGLVLP